MIIWRLCGLALLVFILGLPRSSVAEALVELARPGPWAGVSGLIAYHGKLYLVNSQIFVNHNAADIYSYDPGAQTLRFERHLFSQDAGTPAIIDGFLYWPYEDPRFSTTHGEYAITDGQRWQWRLATGVRGFHVHAMRGHQGALYALSSDWRGRLYRTTDQGQHWVQLYDHPTPDRRVSRITDMTTLGPDLYLALTAWAETGVKLLRWDGSRVTPVSGWPQGRSIGALVTFNGAIYAVNRTDDASRLWRSANDQPATPITALDGTRVQALAATPNGLWAVSNGGDGGLLWHSADGLTWRRRQTFPALPVAITVAHGQVFVGTHDPKRGGALWGPSTPRPFPPSSRQVTLPPPPTTPLRPDPLAQALHELDAILTAPPGTSFRRRLFNALRPLALSRDPKAGQALSERLRWTLPQTSVSLIGGKVNLPMARLARWYLLHAIALNGHGRIPTRLLTTPWTSPTNTAEKYFEPAIAAAWAVAEIGQRDDATIEALSTALHSELPNWAKGDIRAALYRLDGRPFEAGR